MELHECKRCRGDNIYKWHYEFKFVYPNTEWNMTPSLKKVGRRGLFQHDIDPKHNANITQEFSKTWPESNRTPLKYFKVEGKATTPPPPPQISCFKPAVFTWCCFQSCTVKPHLWVWWLDELNCFMSKLDTTAITYTVYNHIHYSPINNLSFIN